MNEWMNEGASSLLYLLFYFNLFLINLS